MKLKNVFLSLFGILLLLFLSQCCTSKEQVEDSQLALKRTNYPPLSISPGTAEITATLLKLIKEKSKITGLFNIDTVHGYGPSTPPIGIGSQLDIALSEILLKDNENELQHIMKEGLTYRLLIKYLYSGINMRENNMWQIINIKNMY